MILLITNVSMVLYILGKIAIIALEVLNLVKGPLTFDVVTVSFDIDSSLWYVICLMSFFIQLIQIYELDTIQALINVRDI